MDCEQLRARLDAYIDGELLPGEYEAMQAHAAVCAECARELRAAMLERELLSQLPSRVAVPLTTQALWRGEVRKEATRRIRRRRVRFICGMAAALVLVLGATVLLRTMPVRRESSPATISADADEHTVSAQPDTREIQTVASQAEPTQTQAEAGQAEADTAQSDTDSETDAVQTIGKPSVGVRFALPTDAIVASDGEAYDFVTSQEAEIASDGEAYDFVIAQDADEPFTAWKKYGCDDINTADATIEALVEEYSGNVEQYSGNVGQYSGNAGQESQSERSAVYRIELPSEYLDDFLSAVSHVGEELDSETLETTGDDAIVYIQIDDLALHEYDDAG